MNEVMTAKEYLGQSYRLDERINSKIEQVDTLHSLACKATSTISDMPGSPSRKTHRMEDIVIKIIDLENEINADIDLLVAYKKEVPQVIESVSNVDEQMVLHYRYVHNFTWAKIGEVMGVNERTIRRWHDLAIDHIKIPKKITKI
ncbi:sigma factor-like helix-turn-helix DNA-binding protein [Eubacteriaceae bacterium ES2]|nr:sigma factor-like helix-turn-helix DNA-binding protein [Eubacteriaceae bacterium ES2]